MFAQRAREVTFGGNAVKGGDLERGIAIDLVDARHITSQLCQHLRFDELHQLHWFLIVSLDERR
jgi:hypothetical protein